MTALRVRGIYTTALTHRFVDEGFDVVQASPPIRRRFGDDADSRSDGGEPASSTPFETREYDATVETTDDRQGVGVTGDPDAVERVVSLLRTTAIDTFAWADDAPRGAVFDAVVEETLGRGAVVALPETTAFLPYSKVDDRVETGDAVRVQVREPKPPWADRRPVVGTALTVGGGIATLSTDVDAVVAAGDEANRRELAGLTDLLEADRPEGWGLRWERDAGDADMDALDEALAGAADRARTIDAALDDAADEPTEPRLLAAPERTTWCWFGRESRLALDEWRREVTTTIPGHHRTKAAHGSASTAVDFAERLCRPGAEFPSAAILGTFGPSDGDRLAIEHGKPDGRLFTLGRGEVSECDPEAGTLTLRREMSAGGDYDGLGVPREDGDVATTKLKEGRWWYPTTYRSAEGEVKGTYLNVCTPVELFPDGVRYVDLHVDVIKHRDGRVERVDDDELDAAVAAGHVREELAEKARSVAASVKRALE